MDLNDMLNTIANSEGYSTWQEQLKEFKRQSNRIARERAAAKKANKLFAEQEKMRRLQAGVTFELVKMKYNVPGNPDAQ